MIAALIMQVSFFFILHRIVSFSGCVDGMMSAFSRLGGGELSKSPVTVFFTSTTGSDGWGSSRESVRSQKVEVIFALGIQNAHLYSSRIWTTLDCLI